MMADDTTFEGFLTRVRAGDGEAAAELVRRDEPAIRLEARLRLGDARTRGLAAGLLREQLGRSLA